MARILIIEDEPVLGRNLRDSFQYSGHEVEVFLTGEDGLERATTSEPDVIVLDLMLPRMGGMEVLRRLRASHVQSSVVIMTAHGDIETAVTAMKEGAEDFIVKSGGLNELNLTIERVLSRRALEENLNYFRSRERQDSALERIIGASPAIAAIKARVRRLVSSPPMRSTSPPTVLITGETGTGKDMIARAIHYEGPRQAQPFVYVNCTAIPGELFESELFGHVKGAFTDARTAKKGLFEVAHRGTIFLDEIGHLNPVLQTKLLAAIEKKAVRPVGATAERPVDLHVIAATNRDLQQAIAAGEFRQDLYHRLRVVTVDVPPLRARVEDVEPLALHFLAEYSQRFGVEVKGITPEAVAVLCAHDWPGNVRELSHVIESVVMMMDGAYVRPEHLPIKGAPQPGGVDLHVGEYGALRIDFAAGTPTLDEVEHRIIESALKYAKHNVSRAARILGLTRDALRYRLAKRGAPARQPPAAANGRERE